MKLKIKRLKFSAGRPVCMIHEKEAEKISLHPGHRVVIRKGKKRIISIVNLNSTGKTNEIAVSDEIVKHLKLKTKDLVEIKTTQRPQSINLIKKKLSGEELSKKEIFKIVNDIARNALTEAEISFFISAVHSNGMSLIETKYLIQAMVKSGSQLKLRGKVVDKHCIGGVAGNRTTPIVVSICAALGLKTPKTSSRAITSAAGTADVIETVARVDFSIRELKKIINKTNACFVWGGALGLAPVDDKIIKVERIVKIDSTAQLLASILSKKISVDSKYVLIDIPFGPSAKVTKKQAKELKRKFLNLGRKFDLKLDVVLTDGSEPIGRGVGPILEMIDVINVLKGDKDAPKDLREKSIMLAGKLIGLARKTKKGQGRKLAKKILDSGKAFKKFEQIIEAQKGKIKTLKPGKYSHEIKSKEKIKIKHLNNKLINSLARQAGCPEDKPAGIYLYKKKGEIVKRGEKIMTIYATSKEKLRYANNFYNKNKKQMIRY
jgi:AMP phosphorylase